MGRVPGPRVVALDALRGFALLGILFGNLTWFTGYAVTGADARAAMATAPLDAATTWTIHFLVDGKFYGIFSLLFGAGLAIVAQRAIAGGESVFAVLGRRLAVLFVLGLAHATLLWFGDIVSLYAVFGLALLPCLRAADRTLLVVAGAAFAVPVILAAVWALLGVVPPSYGPSELLTVFGTGTYAETFAANWEFLKGRWLQAAHSGRPFKLLGLFLLGALAVRRSVALEPERHRPALRRLLVWGFALGVPCNLALAMLKAASGGPALTFARACVDAVAVPSLAIGYSAGLLLWCTRTGPRLAWLANPGRMTLTHYVFQSVVGVALFYGYGLGLWGRLGAVWIVPLAGTIFLSQSAFSGLWLRKFRQGPLEGVWRALGGAPYPHCSRSPRAARHAEG